MMMEGSDAMEAMDDGWMLRHDGHVGVGVLCVSFGVECVLHPDAQPLHVRSRMPHDVDGSNE